MSDGESRYGPGSEEPDGVDYGVAPTPGQYVQVPVPLPPSAFVPPPPGTVPDYAAAPVPAHDAVSAVPPEASPPAVLAEALGTPASPPALASPASPTEAPTSPSGQAGVGRKFAPIVAASIALAAVTSVLSVMGTLAFLAWFAVIPGFIVSAVAIVQGAHPRRAAIAAFMVTLIAGVVSVGVFVAAVVDTDDRVAAPTSGATNQPTQAAPTHAYGTVGQAGGIGDGLWRVGEDIEPGIYRTVAVIEPDPDGWGCDWTTYSSADHSDANTLEAKWGATGLLVADLNGVAEFESSGCGDWERVDPSTLFDNSDAPVTIAEGTWLVGEDVAPGTYRPTVPVVLSDSFAACFWLTFDGATVAKEAIDDVGMVYGGLPTVTIERGQTFDSMGCGTWAAVDPTQFFLTDDAPTKFPQGVWLVGEDIAPGTYSTAVPFVPENEYDACSWSITATWDTRQWQSLDSNSSQTEGTRTVTLETGQRFDSDGCGTWVLTGS
jgi:hypothetical protein